MQDNPFAKYAQQPGITPIGPQDPGYAYEGPKAAADARRAQAEATISEGQAPNAAAIAAAQARRAEAEARLAEIEAQREAAKRGDVDKANKDELEVLGQHEALNLLGSRIDEIEGLYTKNFKGTQLREIPDALGLGGLIPSKKWTPKHADLDAASSTLMGDLKAAMGMTGGEANSPHEVQLRFGPWMPKSGDSDQEVEGKIRRLRELLESQRSGVQAKAQALNLELPEPKSSDNFAPPPQDKMELSKTGTNTDIDPFRQGVAARIGKMIANGAPKKEIMDFAGENIPELPADPLFSKDIDRAIQYRGTEDFKHWQRANPDAPYPLDPGFYTRDVPLGTVGNIMNTVGQSGPGAALISSANAVSGNYMDDIADAVGGNGEAVRTGAMMTRSEHPNWALAGDIAGQAGFEATLGRIPGLRGLRGKKFGEAGIDGIYGAYAGSGEDGLGGAVTGAGVNALGGMAFRGAHRAGTGLARGVKDQNLSYLHRQGVEMTPGDMGRAAAKQGSGIGSVTAGIEDRFAGLPGTESIINPARQGFDTSFNRAAFRQAVEPGQSIPGAGIAPTGNIGAKGVGDLADARSRAYSFLDPITMTPDAPFNSAQGAVRAGLPNLPAFGDQIGKSLDNIDRAATDGLAGRGWQSAVRSVRKNRSSLAGKEFADDGTANSAVGALGQVEDNLFDLAARQGPPGTDLNLQNANALNMNSETILKALDNGPAQRDELFSPMRLDDAARQQRKKFGGRWASLSGDRPFYDLTKAGSAVRTGVTPDSGTAGRALLAAGLTGAGFGAAGGVAGGVNAAANGGSVEQGVGEGAQGGAASAAGAAALMAALYSKPARRALQNALLEDRPAIDAVDAYLKKSPKLRKLVGRHASGMFGGGLARDYYLYPELPE